MKIFFLGGTSYLGREIIKRLQGRKEFELYTFARSAEKLSGLTINIIQDLSTLGPMDVVMNLVVDYGKGKELSEVMAANVNFPLSILSQIKFHTFINFSTGLSKEVSHYAFSKRTLEEKLIGLCPQVINLRLQHFYGPEAPAHNFVTFLVTKMVAGEELPLTDCQQRRDFIFTDDVLDAMEVILRNLSQLSVNEVIELGSGESVRLQDFVEAIKRVSSSSSVLKFGAIERRANEPVDLVANIEKIKKLGWRPKTSLQEGISQTVSFQRRISKT
jgi:CDP-paratose synthetase